MVNHFVNSLLLPLMMNEQEAAVSNEAWNLGAVEMAEQFILSTYQMYDPIYIYNNIIYIYVYNIHYIYRERVRAYLPYIHTCHSYSFKIAACGLTMHASL